MTLGYLAFGTTEYAVWIAMLVYAFEQGGATAAGVVALVQLVPAALFAPIGGVMSDRRRPEAVLAGGYVAQAAALGATAAALLGGAPPVLAYFFATVCTALITITRPAQAVLAPGLARTPTELTGFNVVVGWIESAALLIGPALTGVVLALGSPGLVFALSAALAAGAALLVLPLVGRRPRTAAQERLSAGAFSEVVAGFRAVAEHRGVRLLVLFLTASCVVMGALDVITVVLALDVLDLGEAGAGYLNAAVGAGCVLGAAATLTLIGRRHLMPPLLLGAVGVGAALVLLAVYPTVAGAFGLLALVGAGSTLVDVAGRTLLQRLAPPELLARVFALYESLTQAAFALGAILVPVLVAVGGAEAALVAAGVLLPLLIVLRFRALRAIDDEATVPIVEISLLRSMPIFALLPAPELEGLARSLTPVHAERGTVVIREGEPGDRFYAIADGEVEISSGDEHVVTRTRGDCIGEIALLLDVPRTKTATAATDALLYALEREPFLATVTGHAGASQAADVIVKERVA